MKNVEKQNLTEGLRKHLSSYTVTFQIVLLAILKKLLPELELEFEAEQAKSKETIEVVIDAAVAKYNTHYRGKKIHEEDLRYILRRCWEELSYYTPAAQKAILKMVTNELSLVTIRINKLAKKERQIRRICDNLDTKTKCVVAVLQELAAVEGCSVGVDFGSDLLHAQLRNSNVVKQACKELPEDPDIICLAEVYELANFINQEC